MLWAATALWWGITTIIVLQYATNFELLLLHEGDNNVLIKITHF